MAIDIPMKLIENTDKQATYQYVRPVYEPDPANPKRQRVCDYQVGEARVNKESGNVAQISGADWDTEGFYFSRVARVMIRNHLNGQYPEITGYQA